MKKVWITICLVVVVLGLSGCAAGPNVAENTPNEETGGVAGFWRGLWHGMIAPSTWLVSLFTKSVNFYEVHNNGGWYDFGFVLGAGILAGGGGASVSKSSSS